MTKKDLFSSDKTVLVDFYADWCAPCRALAPTIDEIKAEFADTVKVVKVNVDDNTALAREFGIMSIPTLIVIKNGEVTQKSIGGKSKAEIIKML